MDKSTTLLLLIEPVSLTVIDFNDVVPVVTGIDRPELVGNPVESVLPCPPQYHDWPSLLRLASDPSGTVVNFDLKHADGTTRKVAFQLAVQERLGARFLVACTTPFLSSPFEHLRYQALHDVSTCMETTSGDLEQAGAIMSAKGGMAMPSTGAALWLRTVAEPSILVARGVWGVVGPQRGHKLDLNKLPTLLNVFSTGDVSDFCQNAREEELPLPFEGAEACLAVPIPFDGRIAGVLTFFDSTPRTWTYEEIDFACMMAKQATTVLTYNDWLHVQTDVRRSEARFKSFVQHSSEGVWRVEYPEPISLDLPIDDQIKLIPNGLVAECNEPVARLSGHKSPADLIGVPFARLMSLDEDKTWAGLRKLAELRYCFQDVVAWHKSQDGTEYWLLQNIDGVIEDGKLVRMWCTARDITAQKAMENQIRALAARQQELIEAERTRISREIHDDLGQQLCGLRMMIASAMSTERSAGVPISLGPALSLIDGAIQSSRRISTDLRPPILDHLGLPAAIEAHIAQFRRASGLALDVDVQPDIEVGREQSMAIFRILQECLTNVARHSGATEVMVTLIAEESEILLRVSDNGSGLPVDPGKEYRGTGLGLVGMGERTAAYGGKLTIESQPGRGTAVEARFPISRLKKWALA